MMMINPGFTVVDAMVVCGVDHDILFLEETQATRLAGDISSTSSRLVWTLPSKNLTSTSRHIPT